MDTIKTLKETNKYLYAQYTAGSLQRLVRRCEHCVCYNDTHTFLLYLQVAPKNMQSIIVQLI